MSVATTDNRKIFLGSGTTGPFTFDFRFYNNTDIKIVKTVAGVDTALAETTDYTLTGAGSYSGGSVTLSIALNTGEQITIYRQLPLTQDVDLRNQGAFFAETHEDVFDKVTMILQQHEETLIRCAKVPVTSEYDGETFMGKIFEVLKDAQEAQLGAEDAKTAAEIAQLGAEAARDTAYTYTQVGFMLNSAYDFGSVADASIYFPTDLGGLI